MYIEEDKKLLGLSRYGKIVIILAGILFGFIISRLFLFMPFIAQDDSMAPGIKKGDYILILKASHPDPGDIILLDSPVESGKVILKRFLIQGENSVEIKSKKIYVNGTEYVPKWKTQSGDAREFPDYFDHRDNLPPVKLKQDEIFIIGDNFDRSFDSRSYGAISRKLIIGRMIYKF